MKSSGAAFSFSIFLSLGGALAVGGCSSDVDGPAPGGPTGGAAATGGGVGTGGVAATGGLAATGGDSSGGSAAGGTGATTSTGGDVATGGAMMGMTGGSLATGGEFATGGASSGGVAATGGAETGGAAAGGAAATGGAATGGTVGDGDGDGDLPATLFFDDFEGHAPGDVMTGGSTWTTTLPTEYDGGGIVSIVSEGAYSGSQAVYVKKGNDGQGFLQLADSSVFPFTAAQIYVRTYIKVPEWPENHASWVEVGSATNEQSEIRVGAHQGVLQVNHWPGDQDQIAEGFSMTANSWHCLEFSYEPGQKAVHVWLDDAPVEALTVMGSFERGGEFDPAPPIEAVRFGAEINTTEVYFDDVAVSTEPIGCD